MGDDLGGNAAPNDHEGDRALKRHVLANFFAVWDADPRALESTERAMREGGLFDVVKRVEGWVLGIRGVPSGAEEAVVGRAVFAEGLEVVTGADEARRGPRAAEIARAACDHPDRLAHVPGDFTFVGLDADGAAIAVRSAGGLVPVFVAARHRRVEISTLLLFVAVHGSEPARLDPLPNAIWLSGWPMSPDGRSVLQGVSLLAPGHVQRIDGGRASAPRRWWDPRPQRFERPTRERRREHAARLRDILLARLDADLDAVGNLVFLSGGVDSSSIAALAAGPLGRRISSLTWLPAVEDRKDLALSYVLPLARRYGFENTWFAGETRAERVEVMTRSLVAACHNANPMLCALADILPNPAVRVVVGGEFADEVTGSVYYTVPDYPLDAMLAKLALWMLPRKDVRRHVLRFGRNVLRRTQDSPFVPELRPFIEPQLREEYREWLERRRAAARDGQPRAYLMSRLDLVPYTGMSWEVLTPRRIRRSFPFISREAIELAFTCHPAEQYPDSKRLQRAALRDLVPQRNLERMDKGAYRLEPLRLPWKEPLPVELSGILRGDWIASPPEEVEELDAALLNHGRSFVRSLRAIGEDPGAALAPEPW